MPLVNISGSSVAPSTSSDPLQIGTGASIRTGTSSPESAETGSVGDIFLQTDGTANSVLFIKESGAASNTGWKAYASYSAVTGLTGTTSSSFQIDNDSSGCSVRTAAGSPEGAVTGVVGDIFLRDDGGADTALYVKASGSGNTGWLPIYATGLPGTTSASFQLDNDSSGCSIRTAAGSPESAVTGVVGDIFLRDDGSANSCLYVKESGSGNTGWQAISSKSYHDGDDAQNVKVIAVPIADPAGTFTSTGTIPANSRVLRVDKTISEAFDGTGTVTVGYTGSLSAFAGTSDTDITSTTTQILSMNKASDSTARAVICTVGGTPSQGAGIIYVHYVESTIA